jgi:hypothetical protein
MRWRPAPPCNRSFAIATILGLASISAAADSQIPRNPFEPQGAAAGPAAAANETIEFAGVSQMGKTTHLIFHDKAAKKNRWVSLGETVEGISVVRYDDRLEQAVVKINGTEKTLPLRKGKGPVNSPVAMNSLPSAAGFAAPSAPPAPAPAASVPATATAAVDPAANQAASKPPAPATPETQAKQETEARMLVSDLLEIGMAQRRAYEEAQRRAAEGKTPPAAGEQPAQPGQPGQPPKQ